MTPTPTRSPTPNFVTADPTSETVPGDLVARHERIDRLAPLAACRVDVGVADPGESDVDDDVVRPGVAALDGGLLERDAGARGGVGGDGTH